jgi:hypothetical protein
MSAPIWLTPQGFLGTVTEKVTTNTPVQASGLGISYQLISGALPSGLRISNTGTIYGTPYNVALTIENEFVIRASNVDGVSDRTFYLDTEGPTNPQWLTSPGSLRIGPSGQQYSINGQYVDYQLSATTDALPPGGKLRYYIGDLSGQLPPGLVLSEDGRITGQLKDVLKLSYRLISKGGYDLEPYDQFPYDHISVVSAAGASSTRFISKVYQFYVSVTNGVSTSKQLFSIKVEDTQSLRVDSTLILSDETDFTADAGYLLSPQWLTPANLGYVRAKNKEVLKLYTYDFGPNYGPVYYTEKGLDRWRPFLLYKPGYVVDYSGNTYICIEEHTSDLTFNSTYWELTQLPPNFKLDGTTGILYANIPYQPAYSINYSFSIFAVKTDNQTGTQTISARKFSLTVKGDVESTIEFVTDSDLGTVMPGHISELNIKARHIGTDYTIQYTLLNGTLPQGLELLSDGSIVGKVEYESQTYLRWNQIDKSSLIIDGGSTTFDRTYTFSAVATDVYKESAITKAFTLTVKETDLTKYTRIYVAPLLSREQRKTYSQFIHDPYVFDLSLIYRTTDPNFGIQSSMKLFLEQAIQQIRLDDYADAMRQYFYRKRFTLGEVSYLRADDESGNHVYDLVYVKVNDPLENSNYKSPVGAVTIGNETALPNSTNNMRNALHALQVNGNTIKIDEYQLPRYLRTIQPATGTPLGFILAVPLCYALPGKGETIVNRINAVNFDFSVIDFEVDRLVVTNNLSDSGAKYLLFPRRDMMGENLGEGLSTIYGTTNIPLETEGGQPLELEI